MLPDRNLEGVFTGQVGGGKVIMLERTGMRRISLALIVLVMAAVAMPAFSGDRDELTTGAFVMKLASAAGLTDTTPEVATRSLRAAGWELPTLDNGAILTEGTVVSIANSIGIDVETTSPEATFTSEQTEAFIVTFEQEFGFDESDSTRGDDNNGADPLTKGKGLKKGLRKSPSEPI
jgi:hypothetical protein